MRRICSQFIPLFVFGLFIAALFAFAACSSGGDNASSEQERSSGQEVAQADEHAGHDHGTAEGMEAEDDTGHAHDADAAHMAYANPEEGVDPVCGMKIGSTPVVAEYAEKSYAFCSAACAETFEKDPESVLAAATKGEHEGH